MTEPRYPTVIVRVPEAEAEDAGAFLFELGATGVEQRDSTTLARSEPGNALLVASFETAGEAESALAELPAAWSPARGEVVGDAWRDEWKKHFEPFVLCRAAGVELVVRPPWRQVDAGDRQRVIVLEPGRAFGTGLHETTRLVAEVLADAHEKVRGLAVLDVGCGSGILALVALALGARRARCVDVDPEAVAVTRENAERNGLTDAVEADDAPLEEAGGPYPVVVANIEARPLIELAPALVRKVAPGGLLVLSGVLAPHASQGQWAAVREAYRALALEETRTKGEWLAGVLRA